MLENTNLGVLLRKPKFHLAVTAVVSFSAGAAGAYFVTRGRLELKYATLAAIEIEQGRKFYSKLNKTDEYASPTELVKMKKAVDTLGYRYEGVQIVSIDGEDVPDEDETYIEHDDDDSDRTMNIFTDRVNDDDLDPDRKSPYVITHDEFYENVKDYDQVTLSYFEDDDVLCDDADTPITDSDGIVGDKNLTQFGNGSKDNNVVYIRNNHLSILFEVVRNKGNYAKDVLGFIEHSEHRGLRRFRSDDE